MDFLNNLKFVTEDEQEYFVAEKCVIDEELYCLVINLNNSSDTMFVHADNVDGELIFEEIFDEKIIEEIKEKLIKK